MKHEKFSHQKPTKRESAGAIKWKREQTEQKKEPDQLKLKIMTQTGRPVSWAQVSEDSFEHHLNDESSPGQETSKEELRPFANT